MKNKSSSEKILRVETRKKQNSTHVMLLSPRTKPRQSQNWEGASSSTNKLAHVGQSRDLWPFHMKTFYSKNLFYIILSYHIIKTLSL